jgi:Zn ribbon nucleic-acid-binding protein
METFKYSLDASSKKYVCPNCNKKTFVFYVDTVSGNYLTDDFGRCDREQRCNYHKAPPKGKRAYLIEFLSFNIISVKAVRLVDLNGVISIVPKSQILEQNKNNCFITEWYLKSSTILYLNNESKYFNTGNETFINEVKTVKEPEPVKPSFHSLALLDEMYNNNPIEDSFTTFLKSKFTPDEVATVKRKYFITGMDCVWQKWNDTTVFWQIDNRERIRAAKVMQYDKYLGKRIKKPYNHINWLHKVIKEPDFNLKQCLFGLHLINKDYQKYIAIVESEKTAVIMSIVLPDFIWLATGSKSNFKLELLEPLKKRKCIAYPDKSEFNKWNETANELNKKGFQIVVSDLMERTQLEDGSDLVDYYLSDTMHEMHEMQP